MFYAECCGSKHPDERIVPDTEVNRKVKIIRNIFHCFYAAFMEDTVQHYLSWIVQSSEYVANLIKRRCVESHELPIIQITFCV